MMVEVSWPALALAVTLCGLALVHFVRTPKEYRVETEARNKEAHAEHRRRMDLIEESHDALALKFSDTFSRHDENLKAMINAMGKFSDRLDRMPNGSRRA